MVFQYIEEAAYENFGEDSVVDGCLRINRGNMARKHSRNPDYTSGGMGGGERVKKLLKEVLDIAAFTIILGVTVAVLALYPPLLGALMLGAALRIILEGE